MKLAPMSTHLLMFSDTDLPRFFSRWKQREFKILQVSGTGSRGTPFFKTILMGRLTSAPHESEMKLELPPWIWRHPRLFAPALRRAQKKHRLFRPVIWTEVPLPLSLVKSLAPSRVVVHPGQRSLEQFSKMAPAVDRVVLDSTPPPGSCHGWRQDQMYTLKPTFDFERWVQGRQIWPEPAIWDRTPHPRVLVLARDLTRYSIETQSLLTVARSRPDVQFWLGTMGPASSPPDASIEALLLEPNIRVLPEGVTPAHLYHVQAVLLLLPELTPWLARDRDELLMMMAAGKPIVMRVQPGNVEFKRFVHAFEGPATITARLERAFQVGVEHPDWCTELAQSCSEEAQFVSLLAAVLYQKG